MMIRALWTAATGMNAQQLRIDTISNNLANVNTEGYKRASVSFSDLIYENVLRVAPQGGQTDIQVGTGVRPAGVFYDKTPGALVETGRNLDVALSDGGYFAVERPDGRTTYTRRGHFAVVPDQGLVTATGDLVLDDAGQPITVGGADEYSDYYLDNSGILWGVMGTEDPEEIATLGVYNFANPEGLSALGDGQYLATGSSGEAVEAETPAMTAGYLEASNVSVVQEMVDMIVAQRAYEVSSKAIQTSDEMMGQANNLRR
jgi:flagellar basal-body rod protein FlgG